MCAGGAAACAAPGAAQQPVPRLTAYTPYLMPLCTGAMDDKLLELLVEKKVPTFSMSSGLTLDDFGWGTPTFHKMVRPPAAGPCLLWLAACPLLATAKAAEPCCNKPRIALRNLLASVLGRAGRRSTSSTPSPVHFQPATPTKPRALRACAQGREKINLIYSFTKMGFDVLISGARAPVQPLPARRRRLRWGGRGTPTFRGQPLCLRRLVTT